MLGPRFTIDAEPKSHIQNFQAQATLFWDIATSSQWLFVDLTPFSLARRALFHAFADNFSTLAKFAIGNALEGFVEAK